MTGTSDVFDRTKLPAGGSMLAVPTVPNGASGTHEAAALPVRVEIGFAVLGRVHSVPRTHHSDETQLFISAGSRREWLRAARIAKTPQLWRRGYPAVGAVMAAIREGGSLLEEYAVVASSRRLLRGLGRGKLQPNCNYRLLPGVTATVEASNADGSANLVSLRFRSHAREVR